MDTAARAPKPKFQPFVAQNLARDRMLRFEYRARVERGTLVVRPLTPGWIEAMADLLTDSFVDTLASSVSYYRSFLHLNIRRYLINQVAQPPKAVVLMGLLLPDIKGDGEAGLLSVAGAEGSSASAGSGTGSDGSSTVGSSSGGGGGNDHSSTEGRLREAREPVAEAAAVSLCDSGAGSSEGYAPSSSDSNSSSSDSSSSEPRHGSGSDGGDGGSAATAIASSSDAATGGGGPAAGAARGWRASARVSPYDIEPGIDPDPEAEALAAAGATLIAAVELSFTESTRSRHLTLNPPPTSPYLCNMAVAEGARRAGVGARVLAAAEELAAGVAGAADIHLHLRLQDESSAPGRLYQRAGYSRVKSDTCLLWLLGLERRHLMRKQLAPPGAGGAAAR